MAKKLISIVIELIQKALIFLAITRKDLIVVATAIMLTASSIVFAPFYLPYVAFPVFWLLELSAESMDFKKLDNGYLILEIPVDEGNEPFDKQKWLHGTEEERVREIKKLIKQRLLDDKSLDELKELLSTGRKYEPCYFHTEYINCYFSNGFSDYTFTVEVRQGQPNKVYFKYFDSVI